MSAAYFNEFMSFISAPEIAVTVDYYDWKQYYGKTVVDVGGSYGVVMAGLKAKHPKIRTMVFDLAEVGHISPFVLDAPPPFLCCAVHLPLCP